MTKKTDCDECRSIFELYEDDPLPPCGDVLNQDLNECYWYRIRLLPENEPLWDVYRRVAGQYLVDPQTGVKALNAMTVYATMDRYGVPPRDQLDMLDELFELDDKFTEIMKG